MKNRKKLIVCFLLIGLGIFLCLYGKTYAKYIADSVWGYYLKSKGFYFTSDNLKTLPNNIVNTTWDGNKIDFNLKNNQNQTLISDYDINYTITCSINDSGGIPAECYINGENTNTLTQTLLIKQSCKNQTIDGVNVTDYSESECKSENYTWSSDAQTQNLYFEIIPLSPNLEVKDVSITLSVSSNSPYYKSISSNYTLHKNSGNENKIIGGFDANDLYNQLTITNTYEIDKCVKISWDSTKQSIDEETNNLNNYTTDANNYLNEIKINISNKSTVKYVFYKKDLGLSYSINDFTIEDATGCN